MVISEGWDIPRACMLYQIRDSKSKQLDEQVMGRVRRNPRLLDFETLDDRAKQLAMTAWIWGIVPDTTGGTNIGTRPTSSGYISAMSVPGIENYEWALYPSSCSGSEATYFVDYCYYSSSGVVLFCGGYWSQVRDCGMFSLGGYSRASVSNSAFGGPEFSSVGMGII